MPIYEYECPSCHHHFDLMQRISEEPVKQCPKCFGNSVVKLVSAAGFQLKGTGWYATDFKTPSGSSKESSDKKESAPKVTPEANASSAPKESSSSTPTKSTKGEA